MASSEVLSPAPPLASTGERVLAGVAAAGGMVLLLLISLGTAVIAVAGIGGVALLYRMRGRRLSRRASWGGACAALLLLYAALDGVLVSQMPANTLDQMQAAADSAHAHPSPAVERMRRIYPANPAVQRQTQRMVESRAFTVWIAVMMFATFTIGGALFVGTAAWFAAILTGYAALGRWPMRPPPAAAAAPRMVKPVPLIS